MCSCPFCPKSHAGLHEDHVGHLEFQAHTASPPWRFQWTCMGFCCKSAGWRDRHGNVRPGSCGEPKQKTCHGLRQLHIGLLYLSTWNFNIFSEMHMWKVCRLVDSKAPHHLLLIHLLADHIDLVVGGRFNPPFSPAWGSPKLSSPLLSRHPRLLFLRPVQWTSPEILSTSSILQMFSSWVFLKHPSTSASQHISAFALSMPADTSQSRGDVVSPYKALSTSHTSWFPASWSFRHTDGISIAIRRLLSRLGTFKEAVLISVHPICHCFRAPDHSATSRGTAAWLPCVDHLSWEYLNWRLHLACHLLQLILCDLPDGPFLVDQLAILLTYWVTPRLRIRSSLSQKTPAPTSFEVLQHHSPVLCQLLFYHGLHLDGYCHISKTKRLLSSCSIQHRHLVLDIVRQVDVKGSKCSWAWHPCGTWFMWGCRAWATIPRLLQIPSSDPPVLRFNIHWFQSPAACNRRCHSANWPAITGPPKLEGVEVQTSQGIDSQPSPPPQCRTLKLLVAELLSCDAFVELAQDVLEDRAPDLPLPVVELPGWQCRNIFQPPPIWQSSLCLSVKHVRQDPRWSLLLGPHAMERIWIAKTFSVHRPLLQNAAGDPLANQEDWADLTSDVRQCDEPQEAIGECRHPRRSKFGWTFFPCPFQILRVRPHNVAIQSPILHLCWWKFTCSVWMNTIDGQAQRSNASMIFWKVQEEDASLVTDRFFTGFTVVSWRTVTFSARSMGFIQVSFIAFALFVAGESSASCSRPSGKTSPGGSCC